MSTSNPPLRASKAADWPPKREIKVVLHFFYILVIALTNSLDNLGARIAYSLRGIRITTPVNLWISTITFLISTSAACSGTIVSAFLGEQTTSVIAMLLLSAIGSWMMLQQCAKTKDLEQGEVKQKKEEASSLCF